MIILNKLEKERVPVNISFAQQEGQITGHLIWVARLLIFFLISAQLRMKLILLINVTNVSKFWLF